jgi:hypothetical protein
MIGPIRALMHRWFWDGSLNPEHEKFRLSLTALEREALESAALTEELEARVEILEAEHALEHSHDRLA